MSPITGARLGDGDQPGDEHGGHADPGRERAGRCSRSRPTARPCTSRTTVAGPVTPIDTATNTAGTGTLLVDYPGLSAIVPDQGPSAAFTATASGTSVSFNASGSADRDGSVASYSWSFGDGTTATSSAPTITHAYAKPGSHTATLSVTDNEGCSTTMIFTGHTVSCNGTAAATTTQTVVVAPPVARKPAVSKLSVSPQRFSASGRKVHGHCVKLTKQNKGDKACQLSINLKAAYTLNTPVRVSFKLSLQRTGRKVNGRCVKATGKNTHQAKCTLLVSVHKTIPRSGVAGSKQLQPHWQARRRDLSADRDSGGRHGQDGHVPSHRLNGHLGSGCRGGGASTSSALTGRCTKRASGQATPGCRPAGEERPRTGAAAPLVSRGRRRTASLLLSMRRGHADVVAASRLYVQVACERPGGCWGLTSFACDRRGRSGGLVDALTRYETKRHKWAKSGAANVNGAMRERAPGVGSCPGDARELPRRLRPLVGPIVVVPAPAAGRRQGRAARRALDPRASASAA